MFEKKNFAINGTHVDFISKEADDPAKTKTTAKLFHDLDTILRSAQIHGRNFNYELLKSVEMDMAFMYITRKGIWVSIHPGAGENPSSLSFAHVQMKGIRVFFVENPCKKKVYVVFAEEKDHHIAIASTTERWSDCINFNKHDAVSDFYYSHFDDSGKTLVELLKFIEHKPWNMFRPDETFKRVLEASI